MKADCARCNGPATARQQTPSVKVLRTGRTQNMMDSGRRGLGPPGREICQWCQCCNARPWLYISRSSKGKGKRQNIAGDTDTPHTPRRARVRRFGFWSSFFPLTIKAIPHTTNSKLRRPHHAPRRAVGAFGLGVLGSNREQIEAITFLSTPSVMDSYGMMMGAGGNSSGSKKAVHVKVRQTRTESRHRPAGGLFGSGGRSVAVLGTRP